MSPERRFRLLLVAFWIVPAVVGTIGFLLVPSRLNPGLSPLALLASQLGIWGMWSIWSMVLWTVGDRVPFERPRLMQAFTIHLPLGVAIVTLQILVQSALSVAFGLSEPRGLTSTIVIGVRSYGDTFVVMLCAIIGAQVAFRWYANWQAQRVIAASMGADLAQAQLRALQAQLNPHFLFNALNSVVTLIGRDPAQAQRTVVQLADLLRATLRHGEAQEVPLSQELEVTRRYLAIEQIRFADRLTVHWQVATDLEAMVPAFALQPLVENALVHGIGQVPGAGLVTISASREDNAIVLRVADNGPGQLAAMGASPGASHDASRGAGLGLANLRARLNRMYGDRASLSLELRPEGGAEAVLRAPYTAAASEA